MIMVNHVIIKRLNESSVFRALDNGVVSVTHITISITIVAFLSLADYLSNPDHFDDSNDTNNTGGAA
jgi:hypothetical protein